VRFARSGEERQVGWAKGIPQPLAKIRARRKPLKIERIEVFQIGLEMPFFGQARDWRKKGNSLGRAALRW
jgi:hypothetical protein